jgi:O-antigen/teichoic acid export membrane protein
MKGLVTVVSNCRWCYVSLMLAGMLLSFAKWIVFSNALPPADFGVYSTVITTIAFLSYFGIFGLNEYLIKEGAVLSGKDKAHEINSIRDDLVLIGLINSGVMIFLILGCIYLFSLGDLTSIQYALLAGIFFTTVAFNIVDASLRAALRTLPFAAMVFLRAALMVGIGYALVDNLGLTGVLWGELVSGFAGIFYAYYVAGPRPIFSILKLSFKRIFEYLSKGITFLGLQTFRYFSFAVDKWIVGLFLGAAAVGVYSFLLITFLALTALAGIVNAVLIPRIIASYGKSNNISDLYLISMKVSLVFLAVFLLFSPVYLYLADELIDIFFQKYRFDDIFWSLIFVYLGSALHVSLHCFDGFFLFT